MSEKPPGSVASLVLGIVSIVFAGVIGLVTGIIAIILGNKAIKEAKGGIQTAGLVCGIIGTVLSAIVLLTVGFNLWYWTG